MIESVFGQQLDIADRFSSIGVAAELSSPAGSCNIPALDGVFSPSGLPTHSFLDRPQPSLAHDA